MKKNIIIVLLSTIFVFFILYMNIGKSVAYEVIPVDDSPAFIREAVHGGHDKHGFSVFQDELYTYIYYKSDSSKNEYITTDLKLTYRGGNYVAIATVKSAVNIPSTEKLIKSNKIVDEDLVLKVNMK